MKTPVSFLAINMLRKSGKNTACQRDRAIAQKVKNTVYQCRLLGNLHQNVISTYSHKGLIGSKIW